MLAPSVASVGYLGRSASHPTVKFLNRVFGGRDVALGVWYLMSRGDPERERQALTAGIACDTWDAIAAARSGDGMPRWAKPMVLSTALGAAGAGIAALRSVSPTRR
jgi:hypothetical protein